MVKHIVLFQLKPDMDPVKKAQVMEEFRAGIMALPPKIDCIRQIEVGFNANPSEKYDVALYSEFDTLEDVKTYALHPQHIQVAAIIRPYIESRACSDYFISE